jgi:hypothetical protein
LGEESLNLGDGSFQQPGSQVQTSYTNVNI